MSRSKKTIDQDLIRDLAALLKETDLSEIELEQDDWRIRIARSAPGETVVMRPTPAAAEAPAETAAADVDPASHPGAVPSPMVGTAYLASAPGAGPFVEIGTEVAEGQTLLIVEAMKTMNHIPAPRAGKIAAVLVEDGQPVEFGEPLMIIE
ncbi:MAG: acetyl-CoA carboxylase biotin carboxyl carrier protein [Hyphomicrobiales bacterium]